MADSDGPAPGAPDTASSGADRAPLDRGLAAAAAAAFAEAPDPAALGQEEAAPIDPRLGLILSGWRLDALLGEGRTARVYAASTQEGERAAVKVMNRAFRGDERVRKRLFREANNARRADHHGVAKVLANDVVHTGEPYIVMERLFGRDIPRLMRLIGGPVPEREALIVAYELAEILVHAHTRGLVHRTVAPFATYVTVEGDVKLFDFGSALASDEPGVHTLRALASDLHGYIAPELIRDANANGDERADVWSLGAVLMTMLSGQTVLDATPHAAWRDAPAPHQNEASIGIPYDAMPVALATVCDVVSPDVAAIVESATALRASDRFPTMGALRDAIGSAIARRDPSASQSADERRARLAALLRRFYDSRDELEQEETGAWRSAEVLRELFRLVENVLYSARRHSWEHAETEVRLQYLVERVLAAVADDEEGIFWVVRANAFSYRGETFWEPQPPFDTITYNLFDSGFRKMHLLPGVTEGEAREFLRWLTLDPVEDMAAEDDFATVYWRHEFAHIRCELISAVVLQDVEDYERLDAELRAMKADAIDHLRETIAGRLTGESGDHPTADADAQAEFVISRGSLLDLDTGLMHDLSETLHAAMPLWRGRLAAIIAAALPAASRSGDVGSVLAPYDQFVHDAIDQDRFGDALELFGAISDRVTSPNALRRLALPFQANGRFSRVMRQLVPNNTRLIYGAELPFLAARLPQLLAHVDAEHTILVIDALSRCHDRTILGILLDFVDAHAGGFEEPLGELLRSVNPLLGSNIIAILTEHLSADTIGAIEYAFESEHAKIQVEGAEVLARYSPRRAHRELRKLIRHEDGHIRQRAVEAIGANKLELAAEDLLARIAERDFHALPALERRALMETACRITDDKGEEALCELVSSHGIVANEDLDISRALAVEILAELAVTDEAIAALEAASKKRWWNSKELRASATEALRMVRARLDDLDAELAERGRITRDEEAL